jgi:thioredoxin
MAEIRVVTDATFEEMVLKNERPVVVDFWAVWCGPCKMVAPEMEKIATKYDGQVDVVKVDVDANPGLSRAFNIMSIPTIAFFKPGAQPQGVVGFRPMEQLEQQFGLAEFSGPRVAEPAAVAAEAPSVVANAGAPEPKGPEADN